MSKDLTQTVSRLLLKLNVTFSATHLEERLETHPNFPSVLAVTDVLEELGCETTVMQVMADNINMIETPFLAHFVKHGGRIELITTESERSRLATSELHDWSGVVVVVRDSQQKLEISHFAQIHKNTIERVSSAIVLGLIGLLMAMSIASISTLSYAVLLCLSGLGLVVSTLIIKKDLGLSNKLIDTFCNANKIKSCDAVLKSSGAKVLGLIKLSDAGFIFFVTQFGFLLSYPILNTYSFHLPSTMQIVAFASVPFMIYSLYYQKFVARAWCTLCLAVVSILLCQLLLLIQNLYVKWDVSLGLSLCIFMLFATFFIGVFTLIRPLIEERLYYKGQFLQVSRFKNDLEVFNTLLGQHQLKFNPKFSTELQLGDKTAPIQMVVLSNPFCHPCQHMHRKLDQLLQDVDYQIGLSVRFIIPSSQKEDLQITGVVGAFLQNLLHFERTQPNRSPYLMRQMLNSWYDSLDTEVFIRKYAIKTESSKEVDSLLLEHEDWSKKNNLNRTPSVFINGSKMTNKYSIDDLSTILIRLQKDIVDHAKASAN